MEITVGAKAATSFAGIREMVRAGLDPAVLDLTHLSTPELADTVLTFGLVRRIDFRLTDGTPALREAISRVICDGRKEAREGTLTLEDLAEATRDAIGTVAAEYPEAQRAETIVSCLFCLAATGLGKFEDLMAAWMALDGGEAA